MTNDTHEILAYSEEESGMQATVLVLRDGKPVAVYHVPSFGFKLPELENIEGVLGPKA